MAKSGPNRRKRVPKLTFLSSQGVGWCVSYRDPETGLPTRHRFGIREKEREPEAQLLYHAWVLEHLGGDNVRSYPTKVARKPKSAPNPKLLSGSLLEIATGLIDSERIRSRKDDAPRRRGTIAPKVFGDRKKQIRDFLTFLNERHGVGAVARMRLVDLSMEDVEAYNQDIAGKGYSASQVAKRLQLVKAIVDRAGRPEHGRQILSWNWNSRDVAHGAPTKERPFPTVQQLRRLLGTADLRGQTMIWLGLGLGLGARDLAAIRVGQITPDRYDLRRGKTGVDRYGETPSIVWAHVFRYQTVEHRKDGQLLFVTRRGVPVVHANSNAVTQWWHKLRLKAGESKDTFPGFYTLRHLGATEFGSRPGASIGDVRRWLGHAAGSDMADVYMRPVRPEYQKLINWLRRRLLSERFRQQADKVRSNG